jgi:hypothetical protein
MKLIRQQASTSEAAIGVEIALYVVPSGFQTIESTLSVCVVGGAQALFRVAVCPAGAATANRHYRHYDTPVDPGNPYAETMGRTLLAGDVVRVSANLQNVTFHLSGQEVAL